MVFDDLLLWFIHSQVQDMDERLTRYSSMGSRKVVIRKDVRTAIKAAISGMGLPPKHFSTKSLRSGFGTHVTANGMNATEMKSRGGWVLTSNVPDNHYVRHMHSRGALALSISGSGCRCMVWVKSRECYLQARRVPNSLDVFNIIWGEPSGRDVLGINTTRKNHPTCVCGTQVDK